MATDDQKASAVEGALQEPAEVRFVQVAVLPGVMAFNSERVSVLMGGQLVSIPFFTGGWQGSGKLIGLTQDGKVYTAGEHGGPWTLLGMKVNK